MGGGVGRLGALGEDEWIDVFKVVTVEQLGLALPVGGGGGDGYGECQLLALAKTTRASTYRFVCSSGSSGSGGEPRRGEQTAGGLRWPWLRDEATTSVLVERRAQQAGVLVIVVVCGILVSLLWRPTVTFCCRQSSAPCMGGRRRGRGKERRSRRERGIWESKSGGRARQNGGRPTEAQLLAAREGGVTVRGASVSECERHEEGKGLAGRDWPDQAPETKAVMLKRRDASPLLSRDPIWWIRPGPTLDIRNGKQWGGEG